METGEGVILDSGYLPEAILASGTFPSLFEPAEIDGKILIDGGVVNNYPIEQVRAMGADLIIGVDVQDDLATRESLSSALEILVQIHKYRTGYRMKKKVVQTDIYIRPDIEGYSVIAFGQGLDIVAKGETAAMDKMGELRSVAQAQGGEPLRKSPVLILDSLTINRMLIRGNDQYTRGYIKGKLRFNLAEKIPFEDLKQGINNLSATGNFKAIRYELVSNGLGTDLILKLEENPTKMFIKMSAHYDDLYKSAALIGLAKKNLFTKDDMGSFDFILGDNIRYNLQYYLDKGVYWSFGINSKFTDFDSEVDYSFIEGNFDVPPDSGINKINLDVVDLTNQVYVQTVLREEFAFTLGGEHKLLKYSSRTLGELEDGAGENAEPERTYFENSHFFSTFGKVTLDTYDDKYFPTKGLLFDSDFHLYLFSSDFNENFREFSVAKARLGTVVPLFPALSLTAEASGGVKWGSSGVTSFDFVLGGFGNDFGNNFIPFFGHNFLGIPGNSFVKAYGRLDYEIAPKSHILF